MQRLFLFALPLALIACVEAAPPNPSPVDPLPPANACGADALQDLVGQTAKRLETMRFGQEVRILRPGMAVTADYVPTRLNIEIDAAETIVRVSCY
jgi:hypothetical protein